VIDLKKRYSLLKDESSKVLSEKYGIATNLDSLLLFHEDIDRPAARLSMADLPFSTMKDVIESNKYLQLPRLSSQVTLKIIIIISYIINLSKYVHDKNFERMLYFHRRC